MSPSRFSSRSSSRSSASTCVRPSPLGSKITVNECWDYLRKKKVRPLVYEADLSEEQVRGSTGSFRQTGLLQVPASKPK